jgi:hypothetical protein
MRSIALLISNNLVFVQIFEERGSLNAICAICEPIAKAVQKYRYEADSVHYAKVEIIDDKVMNVVTIGYGTTNPTYYEDRGHCGQPASQGFDVLVDASTGSAFDWRFSTCM